MPFSSRPVRLLEARNVTLCFAVPDQRVQSERALSFWQHHNWVKVYLLQLIASLYDETREGGHEIRERSNVGRQASTEALEQRGDSQPAQKRQTIESIHGGTASRGDIP